MKQKTVKMLCAISMSAVLLAGSVPAMASETETAAAVSVESTETEAASETESETETASERETVAGEETEEAGTAGDQAVKYPDVEVKVDEDTVVIANESDVEILDATISEESEEGTATLTMTDADGGEHVFLEAVLTDMEEPVLRKNGSFLAVAYHSTASGSEEEVVEEGEEIAYEEPVTMYVVNQVNVREEADPESTILSVAELGSEVEVIAEQPTWYKVALEEGEGYISKAYLSLDKESAESAVAAEEAARAQAEAAAAAAAQAQAQAAAQAPQGKYEVSRQAFDDCDGSGHGYYEITYSDGSTAIEEY